MRSQWGLQSTWLRARNVLEYPIKYQSVMDLIKETTLIPCVYADRLRV